MSANRHVLMLQHRVAAGNHGNHVECRRWRFTERQHGRGDRRTRLHRCQCRRLRAEHRLNCTIRKDHHSRHAVGRCALRGHRHAGHAEEADVLRRQRRTDHQRDASRAGKPAGGWNGSHAQAVHANHDELPRRLLNRQRLHGITHHAAVNHRYAADAARHATTHRQRYDVGPCCERRGADRRGEFRRPAAPHQRHLLQVRAVVAHRRQAQSRELALHIPQCAAIAFRARLATLHGIIGEDVEPRHQVGCRDCRRGRSRRVGARQLGRGSASACRHLRNRGQRKRERQEQQSGTDHESLVKGEMCEVVRCTAWPQMPSLQVASAAR